MRDVAFYQGLDIRKPTLEDGWYFYKYGKVIPISDLFGEFPELVNYTLTPDLEKRLTNAGYVWQKGEDYEKALKEYGEKLKERRELFKKDLYFIYEERMSKEAFEYLFEYVGDEYFMSPHLYDNKYKEFVRLSDLCLEFFDKEYHERNKDKVED